MLNPGKPQFPCSNSIDPPLVPAPAAPAAPFGLGVLQPMGPLPPQTWFMSLLPRQKAEISMGGSCFSQTGKITLAHWEKESLPSKPNKNHGEIYIIWKCENSKCLSSLISSDEFWGQLAIVYPPICCPHQLWLKNRPINDYQPILHPAIHHSN